MTGGDFDVVKSIALGKLGSDLINVGLQVALVLKYRKMDMNTRLQYKQNSAPFFLGYLRIYLLFGDPLVLGQQLVGQGELLGDAQTVSTVVSLTGLGNLQTADGLLHDVALLGNKVIVTET